MDFWTQTFPQFLLKIKLFLLIISESIHYTEKVKQNMKFIKNSTNKIIDILPNFNINRYYQKTVVKLIFYVIGYKQFCVELM